MDTQNTSLTTTMSVAGDAIASPPSLPVQRVSVVSDGTRGDGISRDSAMRADGSVVSETPYVDALAVSAGGLRPIVVTGDSHNRVDIILLGDGYTASQIETTYTSHIHDYMSYIFDDSALTQPFGRYENFFNIYAVDVVSNESGADNPVTGIVRDTALDASYRWNGVDDRLLYVNDAKASAAMNAALSGTTISAEMRYVLVNDTTYGGGGGYLRRLRGRQRQRPGDRLCTRSAIRSQDLQTSTAASKTCIWAPSQSRSMSRQIQRARSGRSGLGTLTPYSAPWALMKAADTTISVSIARRSIQKCAILGQPFDPIAREEFVLDFYALVDPLDGYDDNAGTKYDVQSLSVDVIDPTVIHVDWTVNGQTFVDAGETFSFAAYGFGPGAYTVTAHAYDPTDWVRGDRSELEQTVTWTVVNLDQNVAPVITSNGGNDTACVAVPENSRFVTTVTATDPDRTTPTYSLFGGADQSWFTIDSGHRGAELQRGPGFRGPRR